MPATPISQYATLGYYPIMPEDYRQVKVSKQDHASVAHPARFL